MTKKKQAAETAGALPRTASEIHDAKLDEKIQAMKKSSKKTMAPATAPATGAFDPSDTFHEYVHGEVARRVNSFAKDVPFFRTDVEIDFDRDFLAHLPTSAKQHHDCRTCRAFVERFGNLVAVSADGTQTPVFWEASKLSDSMVIGPAIKALASRVRKGKVTNVFLSDVADLGRGTTPAKPTDASREGVNNLQWQHFTATLPAARVWNHKLHTASEAAAAKREEFATVCRALAEWDATVLDNAVVLLEHPNTANAGLVLPGARWLRDLGRQSAASKGDRRTAVIWNAVARAPSGFCHPRSGMLGVLCDAFKGGDSFDTVLRKFSTKVTGDVYMRPTTLPSEQAVDRAEEIVERLGVARAFERRYLRFDEVPCFWTPPEEVKVEPEKPTGVFADVRAVAVKAAAPKPPPKLVDLPPITSTWVKFVRDTLPTAAKIEYETSSWNNDNYTAFTTAVHEDAPAILRWDGIARPDGSVFRNPVSGYCYVDGSLPQQWGLVSGWVSVIGIAHPVQQWTEVETGVNVDRNNRADVLLFDGMSDLRGSCLGLFPACMRAEFHEIRSVIERVNGRKPTGGTGKDGDAFTAGGVRLASTGTALRGKLRVTDTSGRRTIYTIDRWE